MSSAKVSPQHPRSRDCPATDPFSDDFVSSAQLNAGAFVGGLLVTKTTLTADRGVVSPARATRRDLAGRALAVAVFVANVLALSALLGPTATGVLATFPIVFVVLILCCVRGLAKPPALFSPQPHFERWAASD